MKIAFDENIPLGMVRVFQTLAKERKMRRSAADLTITSAKDYAPDPIDQDYVKGSDAPWLERFAKDGGHVVISGDTRIYEKPHEVVAIRRAGLILIMFEAKWTNLNFFKKSALLLWHWQAVIDEAQKAHGNRSTSGARAFRIPTAWSEKDVLRALATPGQTILPLRRRPVSGKQTAPQVPVSPAAPAQRRKRPSRRPVEGQRAFDLETPGKG